MGSAPRSVEAYYSRRVESAANIVPGAGLLDFFGTPSNCVQPRPDFQVMPDCWICAFRLPLPRSRAKRADVTRGAEATRAPKSPSLVTSPNYSSAIDTRAQSCSERLGGLAREVPMVRRNDGGVNRWARFWAAVPSGAVPEPPATRRGCSHRQGVCGCSRGQVQCCDGSGSPSCTC